MPSPDGGFEHVDGKATARTPLGNWLIVALLFLFFAANFSDKAVIGYAGKQISADLGLHASQFGLLGSAFFWLFPVGAILGSLLLRWFTYRWVVAGLMFCWILTMLPLTVPTSFGVLLLCRIALGLAEGPTTAVCNYVVALLFPPSRRALASGIVTAGASVGPLVAAPLFTWIILTWSWHHTFMLLVVFSVLWLVAWLLVSERTPVRLPRVKGAVDAAAAERVTPDASEPAVPLWRVLCTRTVIGLSLLCFAAYILTSLKTTWLPLFMHEAMGYSQSTVGLLVPLPFIGSATLAVVVGWFSGHLIRRGFSARVARGYLAGGVLCVGGISMFLVSVVNPGPLQLLLVVVTFSTPIVPFAVAMQAVADFAPRGHRAMVLGIVVGIYSIAGMFAPLALGMMVDAAPTPAQGYIGGFAWVGVIIAVLAAVAGLLIHPEASGRKLRRNDDAAVPAV